MSDNERPPQLDGELVQQFVIACHRDVDEVKQFLAQEPRLLNASWDWGGGDFENGLEGAAHTGQREIALYLIENGARVSLVAAAMLGQLEVVKAIIDANPTAIESEGAHGIPLMRHALMGGDEAKPVVEFLESRQI